MSQKELVKQIAAKIIRVMTVAPFMAALMLTILLIVKPSVYGGGWHYGYAMLCLVVFPLLAYPTAALIPPLRRKGREGQRTMAIVFAVIGYVAGLVGSWLLGGARIELLIFWTYLLSGISIALSSFVFGVKASGHACGVSGPIAMMIYCLGLPYCLLYAILAFVFWASVKMKRHTPVQLIIGSAIPVIMMFVSIGLIRIF